MQCYERKAMYLMLQADACLEIPDLKFNPALLDEVLSDCAVYRFDQLMTLGEALRNELIEKIWLRAIVELNRERRAAANRTEERPTAEEPMGRIRSGVGSQSLSAA
jgi:hypothetical protein